MQMFSWQGTAVDTFFLLIYPEYLLAGKSRPVTNSSASCFSPRFLISNFREKYSHEEIEESV